MSFYGYDPTNWKVSIADYDNIRNDVQNVLNTIPEFANEMKAFVGDKRAKENLYREAQELKASLLDEGNEKYLDSFLKSFGVSEEDLSTYNKEIDMQDTDGTTLTGKDIKKQKFNELWNQKFKPADRGAPSTQMLNDYAEQLFAVATDLEKTQPGGSLALGALLKRNNGKLIKDKVLHEKIEGARNREGLEAFQKWFTEETQKNGRPPTSSAIAAKAGELGVKDPTQLGSIKMLSTEIQKSGDVETATKIAEIIKANPDAFDGSSTDVEIATVILKNPQWLEQAGITVKDVDTLSKMMGTNAEVQARIQETRRANSAKIVADNLKSKQDLDYRNYTQARLAIESQIKSLDKQMTAEGFNGNSADGKAVKQKHKDTSKLLDDLNTQWASQGELDGAIRSVFYNMQEDLSAKLDDSSTGIQTQGRKNLLNPFSWFDNNKQLDIGKLKKSLKENGLNSDITKQDPVKYDTKDGKQSQYIDYKIKTTDGKDLATIRVFGNGTTKFLNAKGESISDFKSAAKAVNPIDDGGTFYPSGGANINPVSNNTPDGQDTVVGTSNSSSTSTTSTTKKISPTAF